MRRIVLLAFAAVIFFLSCAVFGSVILVNGSLQQASAGDVDAGLNTPAVPFRLVMFLSGMVLFEVMTCGSMSGPSGGPGLVALLLGFLVLLMPLGYSWKLAMLFVSFFVFCWACFARPEEWLGKAFSWTPLRWLGNMSYSYYLLHGLSLNAAFRVLRTFTDSPDHGPLLFWGLMPVLFGWTVVPSAVLYLSVERRFSLHPAPSGGRPGGSRENNGNQGDRE
jgi:peptidoglycan/LPS O-acetylase OafA/YrhL